MTNQLARRQRRDEADYLDLPVGEFLQRLGFFSSIAHRMAPPSQFFFSCPRGEYVSIVRRCSPQQLLDLEYGLSRFQDVILSEWLDSFANCAEWAFRKEFVQQAREKCESRRPPGRSARSGALAKARQQSILPKVGSPAPKDLQRRTGIGARQLTSASRRNGTSKMAAARTADRSGQRRRNPGF